MRILSLEMKGFKSFARAELFGFHDGVTAIVGPNGCGKSNVIDAVRWVLGEQSRKDLRMKASTDVIFGGTANRPAAKQASVTITFENSCGTVPGLGTEFSVTRRLTSSGDSTYLINGQEAKLKQLKDIFAGTGIGPGGFTIMEQGKIDALLQANPEARRKVFEEAAGISLYRMQRAQTESKLEVVSQNLARLEDRIGEARNRLKAIKGAASRALKYREYTARLRVLKTEMALRLFHESGKQREELLLAINDSGREEGKIQKQLSACLMEAEGVDARLAEGEQQLAAARKEAHECELRLQAADGRAREALARADGLRRAAERMQGDLERANGQLEVLRGRLNELSTARKSSAARAEEAQGRVKQAQEAADQADQEALSTDQKLREMRDEHANLLRERNNLLIERTQLESELRAAQANRTRAARQIEVLAAELEDAAHATRRANAEFERQSVVLEDLRRQHESNEQAIKGWNTTLGGLRKEQHQLQMKLSACESKIAHLEELERMLEGVEKGSRELLGDADARKRFGVVGLLAEVLTADISVAPALETALGTLAPAVVVKSRDNAFDALAWLAKREGASATVLVADHFKKAPEAPRFPTGQGILGPLLGEVTVNKAMNGLAASLLGDWLLVADRDVAARIEAKHPGQFRMVTPTGESFGQGQGSLPSSDRTGGVITQRSELERLRRERETLTANAGELTAKLEAGITEVRGLEERAGVLRSEVYDASVSVLEAKTELANLRRRQDQINSEHAGLTAEATELSGFGEKGAGRLREIANRGELLTSQVGKLEDQLSGAAELRRQVSEQRDAARTKLSDLRVEAAEATAAMRAIEQSASDLKSTIADFERRATEDARGIAESAREASRLESEAKRLESGKAEIAQAKVEAESRAEELATVTAEIRSGAEKLRSEERRLNDARLAAREKAGELRRNEERLFMSMNQLRERLAEDFGVDLDAAYRDYNPQGEQTNARQLEEEIETLSQALKRLGPVNMEAVDELEEAESRHNQLSGQEKDLVRAKKALEAAIERIESEARRRYVQTFEGVRNHFQRLFRKMFGGGSADIILLNPQDVLESGLEIIAKPPGMEPKTLSLLSGGQRTMIAVALLFSLFETTNAPFGLLDEVDAALDEANVDRFCAVLKEYAERSQFIVITHHKRTMANADRLYGVTMQEQGISKKVCVDLATFEPGGDLADADAPEPADAEAVAA